MSEPKLNEAQMLTPATVATLRDPKDVASGFYRCAEAGWNEGAMVDRVRARDREVIAEAKRVVEGLRYVGFPEMLSRPRVLAALDAILKEKE